MLSTDGQVVLKERIQDRVAQFEQKKSEHDGDKRNDQRFTQKLPNKLESFCTQRFAHTHFFYTSHGMCRGQVHEIEAGNDEHKTRHDRKDDHIVPIAFRAEIDDGFGVHINIANGSQMKRDELCEEWIRIFRQKLVHFIDESSWRRLLLEKDIRKNLPYSHPRIYRCPAHRFQARIRDQNITSKVRIHRNIAHDALNLNRVVIVIVKNFPDGIFLSKVFFCHCLRDNGRERFMEDSGQISLY